MNLAARERRTVAVGDVLDAPELTDTTSGTCASSSIAACARARDADRRVRAGDRRARAAPRRADDWTPTEISLAEAVAREAAIAIDTSRLLRESTRQAQVERGFYRIAAVLSEPLSAEATLDAVAQAAAEALGGDSAAVLRGGGDELELAGSHELAAALADYLQEDAAALTRLRARRQGARVAPAARRRPLRRGARPRGGGGRPALAARRAAAGGAGRGVGLVLVFFAARRCSTTSSSSSPGTSPARRAARWSEASSTSASAAPGRSRSGSPAPGGELAGELDPDNVLDQAVRHARGARGRRRRLGAHARGRRGRRARRRPARARTSALGTRAPSTGLARRRHRPDALDPRDRGRPHRPPPRRGRPDARGRLRGLSRRADDRPGGVGPGDPRGLRRATARVARGGGRGAARARRQRSRGARERRALPGRQPRAAAQRGDPGERRRRDRRGRPRGQGRALEPRGRARHGRAAGGRARPDADAGARPAARGGRGRPRRQPARSDPARRRGGLALAQRGGDDRPRRRGRRAHLRLPRHLRGAQRRADEVGLRLDRLARAAHAADLDLRLRGDAAPPGRALRRGGAARRSCATSPPSPSG